MGKIFQLLASIWLINYAHAKLPEVIDCFSSLVDTWELRPHPADCNAYISCMNNIGVVFRCPEGLFYDAFRVICDVPEKVSCMAPPTTITTTTTEDDTTPAPVEPANPCNSLSEEGGEVPHSKQCGWFVNCVDQSEGLTSFCPENLHFNALMQVCDIPERAQCLLKVCNDQPDGLLASKNSCKQYIECQSSKATLRSCRESEVFDEPTKMCVPEDDANRCQPQLIPPVPLEVRNACTTEVRSQMIGHPEYCDVYYRCIKGGLSVRKCQSGLYFDQDKSVCVLMGEHECFIFGDNADSLVE
ncbi:conserved hypothetical protein [Culex quinquefasciatus]|uniref:Chitin-binding type-2 domain-containing protein n=1 Tax=Culex quinquefasciatus TaxID=7176 RepID=B0WAB5_CULQU|nr:peritrophin-44 [Culex quinquefasciatus]EDS41005.1 conserved hypothetical protein [Culex quinquefasciatus]|eukprot:XP_001845649.1 conserved hypothetical protein [Culex quinquefasciatus]